MTSAQRGKLDEWDRLVERLFRPGIFIPYHAFSAFVADLRELETEVREQVASNPLLVVARYEDLLAACYEKTGELDDSGSSLGLWVDDLFCGWVQARQAAKADAEQTANCLLAWMDEDPHGCCMHLERVLLKVMEDRARAAFLRGIQARARVGDDGRLTAGHSSCPGRPITWNAPTSVASWRSGGRPTGKSPHKQLRPPSSGKRPRNSCTHVVAELSPEYGLKTW